MRMFNIGVMITGNPAGLRGALAVAAADVRAFDSKVLNSAHANEKAWNSIGTAAVAAGAVAAYGLYKVVGAAADFDKAMSGVQSVANASADEMGRLREAAMAAGADVSLAGVTASSAAEAEMELVKAGVAVDDVLGGALKGSLSLAVAGQLGVADSATIAAQAMNLFKLEGSDVGHVADVLAAGANKSAADVGQLGEALRQGGLLASQTGMDLEGTVGTLAAFADNALIGSDAGTSLKTMLQRLTPESEKAIGAFDQLGISAYDAKGNFVGIEDLAGQLATKMAHLSDEERNHAMQVMFGADAVRAANILYEQGAEGIGRYVSAVDDAGAANRMAAIQTDNLRGDMEALGGAVESMMIDLGENAQGPLRGVTQGMTNFVNLFAGAPEGLQSTVLVIGGLATVVGLAGGAFMLAVPKVAAFNVALERMGPKSQTIGKGLMGIGSVLTGPWGVALAGAMVGLGMYAQKKAEADQVTQAFVDSLDKETGALTESSDELIRNELRKHAMFEAADKLGISGNTLVASFKGEADAVALVNDAIDKNLSSAVLQTEAQIEASRAAGVLYHWQGKVAGVVDEATAAWQREYGVMGDGMNTSIRAIEHREALKKATEGGTVAVGAYGDATATATAETEELTAAQEALVSAIEGFVDPMGVYAEMLQKKQEREQKAADKLDGDTKRSAGYWERFKNDVKLSLNEYHEGLRKEIKAQEEWESNLMVIAKRGGREYAELLRARGPEAAGLVAQMTKASNREFREGVNLELRIARRGSEDHALILDSRMTRLATIAQAGGKKTAEALARQLEIGVGRVKAIADQYGIELADSANAVLRPLDKPLIQYGMRLNTGGQVPGGYGAYDDVMAMLTRGEYVHNTGAVQHYGTAAMDAVNDKRAQIIYRNAGGPIDPPPSFSPYTGAVGDPARATTGHLHDQVAAWVAANTAAKNGNARGLNSELLARFNRWDAWAQANRGVDLGITSGWRSSAEQAVLYARYLAGLGPVAAPPGSSNHERGLAIDYNPASWALSATARQFGLHFPVASEPWHAEMLNKGGHVNPPRSFDTGGWLQPGLTLAHNGTGIPERVVASGAGGSAAGQGFTPQDVERIVDRVVARARPVEQHFHDVSPDPMHIMAEAGWRLRG